MNEVLDSINDALQSKLRIRTNTNTTTVSPEADTCDGKIADGSAEVQSTPTPARKQTLADKFDPKNLRISQNFAETTATQKKLTSVPVTKPNKQQWVRVHPSELYRENVAVIEIKEGNQMYVVNPELVSELASEIVYVTLFTAITREGNTFIWPVKLPDAEGRSNNWNESALEAAMAATTKWVRVVANMGVGAYEFWEAPGNLAEPKFPSLSFAELLSIAFKGDRFIESIDHPLVARLNGTK